MPADIDLDARYLDMVQALLQQHVPDYEVWAYGRRVSGDAHAASDLDLVVRDLNDRHTPCDQLFELRTAFVESNLPIRVDVMDWARIPEVFRHEIERCHMVLQGAR